MGNLDASYIIKKFVTVPENVTLAQAQGNDKVVQDFKICVG